MENTEVRLSGRLSTINKNAVLIKMAELLETFRAEILELNNQDVRAYTGSDQAMIDRLVINEKKIDGMIESVLKVANGDDPVGKILYEHTKDNGLKISNQSVPFGSILIIYESRPDVTIEAAALAFKAGNKILLKGGKEALFTNQKLVHIWHESLSQCNLPIDWIQFLNFNRDQTQAFLKNPDQKLDLIVPRGGEKLIQYVKTHSSVPVIVSGRGNNFLYVHETADWEKSCEIILNAKTSKISACNALDKVLLDKKMPQYESRLMELVQKLQEKEVEIIGDEKIAQMAGLPCLECDSIWEEEFLSMKLVLGEIDSVPSAIQKINKFCGGHSVTIMTEDNELALDFMHEIDATAVYQNASTRFTDGGQFGLGAELGISTEKLHHRGPLGLEALVSNKWFVFGDGQIRN